MAIIKELTITVKDNTATLSENLFLYKGDGGITLLISILENRYKFGGFISEKSNVIEESQTQWASVCVLKAEGEVVKGKRCEIYDDMIRFEIDKTFLDDVKEVGTHSLQIHLYDSMDEDANRLTIPPVSFTVLETICEVEIEPEPEPEPEPEEPEPDEPEPEPDEPKPEPEPDEPKPEPEPDEPKPEPEVPEPEEPEPEEPEPDEPKPEEPDEPEPDEPEPEPEPEPDDAWSEYIANKTNNHTNYSRLFENYTGESLDMYNMQDWDTSQVTDMSHMFYCCTKLTELNVSNFNTKNVTNMLRMFYGCEKLTSLDVSNFGTSQVTDMQGMFNGCRNLTELNVSNFDTENVTDMSNMFSYCSKLTELNVSNFNTKNVTNMAQMFNGCYKLETLDLSRFDLTKESNPMYMLSSCQRLEHLYLNGCDRSTIEKIIYSEGFPTGNAKELYTGEVLDENGQPIPRIIYCDYAEGGDLEAPDGWEFDYYYDVLN